MVPLYSIAPLGQGVERAEEETFFLRQLRPALRRFGDASGSLVLWGNIEFFGPVGGWG